MVKLEIQNLILSYEDCVVLRGISFKVMAGEMLGLIGPNGCGKSTLIRGMSRVITPLFGHILLDGQDIFLMSQAELARRIAVVPQTPSFPEAFTALELVLMGRTPHLGLFRRESKRDIELSLQAMEVTRTLSLWSKRVEELSGGEKQRLVVARALAQEPEILLLDEPTAHLDIKHQVEILHLVKNLCKKRKLSVVIALHDLNLASQYCDRIVLLNHGRIHAKGKPAEVITVQNIGAVYGAETLVFPHPFNGLPVALVAGKGQKPDEGE